MVYNNTHTHKKYTHTLAGIVRHLRNGKEGYPQPGGFTPIVPMTHIQN